MSNQLTNSSPFDALRGNGADERATNNNPVRTELVEGQTKSNNSYNPDVLTCLANLSNDEVFTPPELVNKMLDLLPAELWQNKEAKFLDPVTKSGVFIREIAKRLNEGLKHQIPDQQTRINHIFTQQLFGIAITELTSLLARRSVYCSKIANGKYSICNSFSNSQGNIRYHAIKHTWQKGKCKFCGASQEVYDRAETLESHAYAFIHTDKPSSIFGKDMKFDVIIGNPPYQLNDGGGTGSSAIPIYQKFIQQAKKLNPQYLSMIVPARWFSGGRGLDEFRDEMLNDKQIRVLHDYPNSDDCFHGVNIEGGVCYFLWDKDNEGLCKIYAHSGDSIISESERPLLENNSDTFIRFNEAIPILQKISKLKETSFANIISANDPFGFDMREDNSYKRIKPDFKTTSFPNSVNFYYNGWKRDGLGHTERTQIRKNTGLIDSYKVYISKAYGMSGGIPSQVINQPILGEPNSCCTETYLLIGPLSNSVESERIAGYMRTRFFRFLVLLIKNTQNAMKKVYSFVPMQDFSEDWSDKKLYAKYGLTQEEIAFIESMIRPMEPADE